MEAGEGTPNSGRGRERRRRDGIKRVVLKRGEATDAGVTEEPRQDSDELLAARGISSTVCAVFVLP